MSGDQYLFSGELSYDAYAANISPICPPALVRGALPNVPAKNLTMRIIGRFVERAPAMLKIANKGYEALKAHLRPNISERGAQSSGPTPKPTYQPSDVLAEVNMNLPRTYKLNPAIPSS